MHLAPVYTAVQKQEGDACTLADGHQDQGLWLCVRLAVSGHASYVYDCSGLFLQLPLELDRVSCNQVAAMPPCYW